MSEEITLTTPVPVTSKTGVKLKTLVLDLERKTIEVTFIDNNGLEGQAFYTTPATNGGPSGATLLNALNTANLSGAGGSLVKRVLQRLQTDGYIGAGSVTGTPD